MRTTVCASHGIEGFGRSAVENSVQTTTWRSESAVSFCLAIRIRCIPVLVFPASRRHCGWRK